MVQKCFVRGCKTHKLPKNTTFGVPKDPEMKRKWEDALRPYSYGKVLMSKHRVCKAHFTPDEMEFFYIHMIKGTEVKIERGRPVLKDGAIPSVFFGHKKTRRRILDKFEEGPDKRRQAILLSSGEWVHLKQPKRPVAPRKILPKRARAKGSTAPVKQKSSSSKLKKQVASTLNINDVQDAELPVLINVAQVPEPETDSTSNEEVPAPELPLSKPPDKDLPSICINWDAMPLPEEIGSLLCSTIVPPINSSTAINVQPPMSHSTTGIPSPMSPTVPSPTPLLECQSADQPSEQNPATSESDAGDLQEEEDNIPVTFQGLLLGISHIQLPSSMWAAHTDQMRVFFSFMSYGSTGCTSIPKVEKVVMYQGLMMPRVFLRGIEVSLPITKKKSTSLEDVEKVLYHVDNLKLCLGTAVGDVVSYTLDCDIFIESGSRLPRCPSCKLQKAAAYSKRRHLEIDNPTSRSSKKKQV